MSRNPVLKRSSLVTGPARLGMTLVLLIAVMGIMPVPVARADNYVVSNTDDSGGGSLRQAILDANARSGYDTITFTTSGTITLGSALPQITDDVTITGPGAGSLSVHGANTYRIFDIGAGTAVTITGVTIRNGNATDGSGIYNRGTLMLGDSTVTNNTATNNGGGIYNDSTGTVLIYDASLTNNTSLDIQTDDGGGAVMNLGTLTLESSTLSGNHSDSRGGAIRNEGTLTVTGSTIANNTTDAHGGAIYSIDGPVSIADSEIANNVADSDDQFGGDAGGIQFIANTASVTLTLESSTVSSNTAMNGGGIQNLGFGDGVTATMVITNSTISANTVDDYGGGIISIFNVTSGWGASVTDITNSTIANNTADSDDDGNGDGGGIYAQSASGTGSTTVYIKNTIIADNIDATTVGSKIPDCSGTLNSRDYNLIEVTTGCTVGGTTTNNITGQDPNLGPLADNGGDTETHALLPVSPAVNAGTCVGAPAADQRGVSRPQGAACDIGAYEAEVELTVVKTVDDDTPVPEQLISYTVTVSNTSALTATNVLISDTLSTDLTFATGSITLDPPGAGTAGTAPPTLAQSVTISPGQQVAVTFSAIVNVGTSADTIIENTAAVTSTEVLTPQTDLETLTVSNAAPVARDDSASADESGPPVLVSVLVNDTDANGDTLYVSKVGAPNFGSVDISGTTQITYTPANRTGDYDAVFTYTVSDGSLTGTAVVTVAVTADNDGLTANDDSDSITEEEVGSGTVVAVDEDEDDVLSYDITAQPAYGSAGINATTGEWTYTPANRMNGYTVNFTVTVSDTATPTPHTDTALVTVIVDADNDGLTASDDSDSITEDGTGSGTVVAVDEDEDDVLSYGISIQPAHGSADINATTGDWTYTPANRTEDYVANFTVTVSDTATPTPHTDTALVTVLVDADNDGLTAIDDSDSITEEEIGSGTVVAIDEDEDDVLSYGITAQPAYGSAGINATTGEWTYTPANRMDGYTVNFTVTVSDTATPTPHTDTALVTVMVDADNDGLTASDDSDSITEDGTGSGTVIAIDEDEDDVLSYDITAQPAYGSADINATTGEWTYTPANRTETYGVNFTVTVRDTATPTPNTDTALVTVIVTADNDGLTANGDSASITEEEIGSGTIVAVDEDENDVLSYGISIQPVYGSADINETGEWTYTPANRTVDYLDSFIVVVSDTATPTPHTATAIVNVTVSADNDPPDAVDDTVGTPEDTPRTISVLDNDIDPENAPLTVIAVGTPITGSASTDGTTVTYTPTVGFIGMDVFTYTISDGNLTDTATVNIYVGNAPPVANDDAYITTEDEMLSVPAPGVLDNDTDLDNPTLYVVAFSGTLELVTVSADGSFDFDPRGIYDYLVDGEQAFYFFTYVVSDGVLTDTATVTITINGVDDAPVANDDAYATTADALLSVPAPGVLGNDIDPDSPILSVVSTSGTLGLVTVSADGSFDFDPRGRYDYLAPGEQAFFPFTYVVSDGVLTDTATVTITINAVGSAIYLPLVARN